MADQGREWMYGG
jgi:hypothetical protein